MRLLLQTVVFWGPLQRQHLDVDLWCPSSCSISTFHGCCLNSASASLLAPHFGSTKWFSQWRLSPTFVHIEYESKIGMCLDRVTNSCNPPIVLWRCDLHCWRIGSLESSLVSYMSNLKFNYLELRMWLCGVVHLSRSIRRSQEKRAKEQVGQNINHRDLVFEKSLQDSPWNWQ